MEYIPINWGLISNPINWVIVLLMVTIAAIPLAVIAGGITLPSNNSKGN